jgi:hypothetical protein
MIFSRLGSGLNRCPKPTAVALFLFSFRFLCSASSKANSADCLFSVEHIHAFRDDRPIACSWVSIPLVCGLRRTRERYREACGVSGGDQFIRIGVFAFSIDVLRKMQMSLHPSVPQKRCTPRRRDINRNMTRDWSRTDLQTQCNQPL